MYEYYKVQLNAFFIGIEKIAIDISPNKAFINTSTNMELSTPDRKIELMRQYNKIGIDTAPNALDKDR